MDQKKLILGYWPIRGLAQPLRFFMNYLEVPFEEKQYTDRNEWFEQDKPAFNNKLANLPYLKDGDQVYFESDSLFYVIANKAHRLDLVGMDGEQMARVSVARSLIGDIKTNLVNWVYDKVNFESKRHQVLETLRKKFDIFNDILEKYIFTAGNTITYVDFIFWEYVDEISQIQPDFFEHLPNIQQFYKAFSEIPQNMAYLASEKYLAKPFNYPQFAAWY